KVEVILLHILAVIAFGPCEPEEPLFQDQVLPVPERQREAEELPAVADAAQPVLVPPVSSGARVVMGEVGPCAAVRAVILAHGTPRALAEVRPPALPVRAPL